jgi:mannose-6-phosphate isomerase-like protein (cupin superfamily)
MPDYSYAVHMKPLFGVLQHFDIQRVIDVAHDAWYNQTLIQIGDMLVRLGVMQGEYHWHRHDEQDELFIVLDGTFHIELDGQETVVLTGREAFCVPAGLRHRPIAPTRACVLMFERSGITPTGDESRYVGDRER